MPEGSHALQYIALFLSPLPFAVVLWLACLCGKAVMRTNISAVVLVHAFSPALIPVAVGYNVAHYFTLVGSHGPAIVRLLSDPPGRGWDLWGTAGHHAAALIFPAEFVWHLHGCP